MQIPRRIFVLWLQGEEKAPHLVKMCLLRWRRLNPDYELTVLDRADVKDVLEDFPVPFGKIQPQALSDVLRIKLLADRGGVWTDATVFPVRPLDDWLPAAADSGFFAFRGHALPLDVDSWFLAAAPGHPIPRLWWQEISGYWHKPRRLIEFSAQDWMRNYNFDPLSFFRPDQPNGSDSYPYYWLMFMFTHLLHTNDEFRAAWERVQRRAGLDCHVIQRMCAADPGVSDRDLVEASLGTPVQKLSFKDRNTRRWLSLDQAFNSFSGSLSGGSLSGGSLSGGSLSRGHGDTESYVPEFTLSDRIKSATPMRLRALAGRVLERLRPWT